MQLIDDLKTKYPRYWSVWCHVAAALLGVLGLADQLGVVLPLFQDKLSPVMFFGLSILCTLAGLVARAIKQSSLNPEESNASAAQ
jgi:hypothetical protein